MSTSWGDVISACNRLGLDVQRGKGGECKIVGPGKDDGKKRVMRVGHNCCKSKTTVVYVDYVKKFERTFGAIDV